MAEINKSTCAHIMETLCESFFVEKISRKEGYRLGPWSYMLSRKERYHEDLLNVSESILKWLHTKLKVTIFLDVVCNGRKYVLYYIDNERLLPHSGDTIIPGEMETTATGLLHMAFMDNESLRKVINPQQMDAKLKSKLATIKKQKYSYISYEKLQQQSFAFNITNGIRSIASIGVVYPNKYDSPEFQEKIIQLGKTAATEISRRLTFLK